MFESLKAQARKLRQHTLTVYFAARDPRTPMPVRVLALLVAAYALSPIDLIPDFIPVLGYLDDLILVPLGLALVIKLTPLEVMDSAGERARQASNAPVSHVAAACVVVAWIAITWFVGRWLYGAARA